VVGVGQRQLVAGGVVGHRRDAAARVDTLGQAVEGVVGHRGQVADLVDGVDDVAGGVEGGGGDAAVGIAEGGAPAQGTVAVCRGEAEGVGSDQDVACGVVVEAAASTIE
jgi:hypothetical protein